MDNIAWYRKYRPLKIEDYMGDNIKHIVNNRFTVPENRPNVILLYGNKGCGKTTFARIISKYYLCENQVDGRPCESCDVCNMINEVFISGETGVECPGIQEIDATKTNGKDDIQNIIDEAIIAPIYTKYKILIFDECHMITPQAQNSLLKIIEDVPKHLVVIFCTTEPEKVLPTIHSRCQVKLEVRKKNVDELANRLMYIAKCEGLECSLEALKLIAKKADRTPRDAINLLEDIAKSYGKVTIDTVREHIGENSLEQYIKFIEVAKGGEVSEIVSMIYEIKRDIHYKTFINRLTRFVIDSVYIKMGIGIEDYTVDYLKVVKRLFDVYTSGDINEILFILEEAYRNISDDDTRNELVLINTALRIGNITLSKGNIVKENEKSLKAHKELIRNEVESRNERVITRKVSSLHDIFNIKEVTVDLSIGSGVNVVSEDEKASNNDGFVDLDDIDI
ncbi:MAG: AAA family ATPase [Candidatus Anstonellales archaeon]